MAMYSDTELKSMAFNFWKLNQFPVCKYKDIFVDCEKYDIMNTVMKNNYNDCDLPYTSYDKRLDLLKTRISKLYRTILKLTVDIRSGMDSDRIDDHLYFNICTYYSQFIIDLYRLSIYLRLSYDVFDVFIVDTPYKGDDEIPEKITCLFSDLDKLMQENIKYYNDCLDINLESCINMILALRKFSMLVRTYVIYTLPNYFKECNHFISICITLLGNNIHEYANLYQNQNEVATYLYKYIAEQIALDDYRKSSNIFPSNTSTIGEILEWCNNHAYDASIILKDFRIGNRADQNCNVEENK